MKYRFVPSICNALCVCVCVCVCMCVRVCVCVCMGVCVLYYFPNKVILDDHARPTQSHVTNWSEPPNGISE